MLMQHQQNTRLLHLTGSYHRTANAPPLAYTEKYSKKLYASYYQPNNVDECGGLSFHQGNNDWFPDAQRQAEPALQQAATDWLTMDSSAVFLTALSSFSLSSVMREA